MTAKKKTNPAAKPEQPSISSGLLDEARTAALASLAATPEAKRRKGTKLKPAAPDATPPAVAPEVATGTPTPAVPLAIEPGSGAAVAPAAPAPANGKGGKKPKAPKPPKTPKPAKPPRTKRVSALDAAAQVIAVSKEPMRATDMIAAMESKGLWKSPGGKTPEATLYAAIIREISAKGKEARFVKHDRGLFVAGLVPAGKGA